MIKSVVTVLAVIGATNFTAGSVSAQDNDLAIDEIIVTAQKRAENLQQVPIAITAIDGLTIEKARIQTLDDIANRTPGFFIGGAGPVSPELTIRGIGSTDRSSGSDRSVVVFLDEVYIGRAGGSTFDLFDLERIEVLRGPQGTLFGRNVVGGLIHVVSKKPSADPYAKIQATVGNYDLIETKAVFNAPLSDTVFSKVSFSSRDRDGVNTNIFLNKKIDNINSRNVRGQLKIVPDDSLQVLLSGNYALDDIQGLGFRPLNNAGVFGVVGFIPSDNFRDFQSPVEGFLDREIYSFTARVDKEMSIGNFTSISSYRVVDFFQDRDFGVASDPNFSSEPVINPAAFGFMSRILIDERSETFTQEMRLASHPDSGKLNWLVGAYYLNEKTDRDQERKRNLTLINGAVTSSHPFFEQKNSTSSFAVFGEASFEISDKLEITVGGRQTWDKKTMDLTVTDLDPLNLFTNSLNPATAVFPSQVTSEKFNSFTPKATITFTPTDNTMAYATVSKGFKSGGFNGLAGEPVASATPFLPETAWNYEIGIKTQLFDNRLQLNLAGFWLDFKDLQLRRRLLLIPGNQASNTIIIANASQARIKGVELETIFKPFPGFTITGNLAYTDAILTDATLKSSLPTLDVDGLVTAEGQKLPRAPEITYFVAGEYEAPIGNGGAVVLRAETRYTDDVFHDLGEPDPGGHQDSYNLVNGSITYIPGEDSAWEFKVWGKNILNKEYFVWEQPASGARTAITRIGDPATVGFTITWRHD